MRAILAVVWGFLGIRKGRDWQADAANIKPTQIVVAGIVGLLLFVLALLALVNWIAR